MVEGGVFVDVLVDINDVGFVIEMDFCFVVGGFDDVYCVDGLVCLL